MFLSFVKTVWEIVRFKENALVKLLAMTKIQILKFVLKLANEYIRILDSLPTIVIMLTELFYHFTNWLDLKTIFDW